MAETGDAEHVCGAWKRAGRPHLLRKGTRFECECGKVWVVTRYDRPLHGHNVCGCGWAAESDEG